MCERQIMLLLASLILNWPIIKEMGFGINKPLLILVPNVFTLNQITKHLSWNGVKKVGIFEKNASLDDMIYWSSEAVFIDVSDSDRIRSNKLLERLELIMATVSSGGMGRYSVDCLPILLSSKGIPSNLKDRAFFVSIDEGEYHCSLDYRRLIPSPNNIGLIQSRVLEDQDIEDSEKVLLAAAYCIHPAPETAEEREELRALKNAALKITRFSQGVDDPDGIAEIFKADFQAWVNSGNGIVGYQLPELQSKPNMECSFFFNNKAVFFHPKLFEKIGKKLIGAIGENALKNALAAAGILIPEKGAQSCRMYYRVQGATSSKRMLKFNIDALDQVGEVSLYDLCFQEKEV